jgi:hypothetical protein
MFDKKWQTRACGLAFIALTLNAIEKLPQNTMQNLNLLSSPGVFFGCISANPEGRSKVIIFCQRIVANFSTI